MHEILETQLDNIVYFKKSKAKLNKPGLTFVRGLNLDSDPAQPSGNGAGKSLFFSSMPNVFYFSPPLSIKKKAKKEILGKKGASITVSFKSTDGHVYSIQQLASKYVIKKDDVDLQIRTVPLAETYIRSIFPLSEVEYYTTCFVSTQKLYPFQNDSNLQRVEHLISVFGLDQYEKLKAHFALQLAAVKGMEVKISVLEQRRLVLKEKLSSYKGSTAFDDTVKAELDKRYRVLDKQSKALQSSTHDLQVRLRDMTSLLQIEHELQALRAKYTHKQSPKDVKVMLREQAAALNEWASYTKLLSAYNKSKASLQEKLKNIKKPAKDVSFYQEKKKSLKADIKHREDHISDLEDLERDYNKGVKRVAAAKQALKDAGITSFKSLQVDKTDYTDQVAQCRTTLKLKSLLHDHDEGKCPTCRSDIDYESIRKMVKKAASDLETFLARQELQELTATYLECRAEFDTIKFDGEELSEYRSLLSAETEQLAKVESLIEDAREYESVMKSVADLSKPAKPEQEQPDVTQDEIDAQVELCDEIMQHLSAKKKLLSNNEELSAELGDYKSPKVIETHIDTIAVQLHRLEKQSGEVRTELGELATKRENMTKARSEYTLYKKDYDSVVSEIKEIKPQLEKKQVLDVLVKAYGAKGLRTLAAAKICSLLEQNLNQYRGLVFAEPFTFSVVVTDQGMAINVDRGNNIVSDVRNLSGAESNCFRMLFVLSILPLIPSDRRINMIVLDEPTSHADDVTRSIFRERYLPALMEVVPSIYVITPHADDYIEGSAEWLVQKRHGISTIVTGDEPVRSRKH